MDILLKFVALSTCFVLVQDIEARILYLSCHIAATIPLFIFALS